MAIYIFALMDNAQHLNARCCCSIKDDMTALWKAEIAFLDFVPLFAQFRTIGQPFKPLLQF